MTDLHVVAPGLRMTREADAEAPGGYWYPLILDDGYSLTTEAVEALATERDNAVRSVRELLIVVADESRRLPEQAARLRAMGLEIAPDHTRLYVRGLRPDNPLPLVFLDSQLVIGTCEDFNILAAGTFFGSEQAEGECLLAKVRLNDSRLATVAWGAVRAGLFGGLCADVRDWNISDDGTRVDGRISRVMLSGLDDVCLAGARVVEAWEGETSVWASWRHAS
jgi:hypothetical protein